MLEGSMLWEERGGGEKGGEEGRGGEEREERRGRRGGEERRGRRRGRRVWKRGQFLQAKAVLLWDGCFVPKKCDPQMSECTNLPHG